MNISSLKYHLRKSENSSTSCKFHERRKGLPLMADPFWRSVRLSLRLPPHTMVRAQSFFSPAYLKFSPRHSSPELAVFGHVVRYKLSRVALGTRMSLRLYSYFSFRLGFRHFNGYDSFFELNEGKPRKRCIRSCLVVTKKEECGRKVPLVTWKIPKLVQILK